MYQKPELKLMVQAQKVTH